MRFGAECEACGDDGDTFEARPGMTLCRDALKCAHRQRSHDCRLGLPDEPTRKTVPHPAEQVHSGPPVEEHDVYFKHPSYLIRMVPIEKVRAAYTDIRDEAAMRKWALANVPRAEVPRDGCGCGECKSCEEYRRLLREVCTAHGMDDGNIVRGVD